MGISPPSYGNQPTFLWESAHLLMGISPPFHVILKNNLQDP